MSKKRILLFGGIAFALAGLICLALCVFQDGKKQLLLNVGLMANSIAFVINCVANKKEK